MIPLSLTQIRSRNIWNFSFVQVGCRSGVETEADAKHHFAVNIAVKRDAVAASTNSVSEHFAHVETEARLLMHVEWLLLFRGQFILGLTIRSKGKIYGVMT